MSLDVTVVEAAAGARITRGLRTWLSQNAPKKARGCVTVAVVSDAEMRRLNRRFRKKDAVTDVLSFPAVAGSKRTRPTVGRVLSDPPFVLSDPPFVLSEPPFLGEVVIAKGLAARQAREFGHRVGTEVRILALHGLLHLLGYDHEVDRGEMARVEARLRRQAGLPEGLIARSS